MENKIIILVGGYVHNVGEIAIVNDESEQLGTFPSIEEAEDTAEAKGLTYYRVAEIVGTKKIPTLRKNPHRTTRDTAKVLKIIDK